MRRSRSGLAIKTLCLFVALLSGDATRLLAQEKELPAEILEVVESKCLDCHAGSDAEAGFDLESVLKQAELGRQLSAWTKVHDRVVAGDMPPADYGVLEDTERQAFEGPFAKALLAANLKAHREVGRTQLRRLNREEYESTVQDLLGITTPLAGLLPAETPQHGFDTVSGGLRFSALHLEKYLEAADVALSEAVPLTERPKSIDERFLYTQQEGIRRNLGEKKPIVRDLGNAVALFADASYIARLHGIHLQQSGQYRIRVRAYGFQCEDPVILRVHAGNWNRGSTRVLGFFDLAPDEPREVEVIARLEAGEYLYPAPDDLNLDEKGQGVWHHGGASYGGEGIAIEWIEVEGPLLEQWPPESVKNVFGDVPVVPLERSQWIDGKRIAYEIKPEDPRGAARAAIERFCQRAFRRPTEDVEADPYVDLAHDALDQGMSFKDSVLVAMRAVLTSPQFLVLQEKPGQLDDHALAARLSYFLWGTMPDEELTSLAREGRLSNSNVLAEQTERLLNDPRSDRFVRRFIDQWLGLHQIDATSPDERLYPEFDELLKRSMLRESHAFFKELIRANVGADRFIDSDFVMINRRLAEHYGIEDVQGQDIQRVELPDDSPRGGVMTQAAVLKVTANGTVTSPVTRGTWVMTHLLNQPPSPPPPAVGSIEPDTRGATTVREQLALHRRDASCASCHVSIDPPGFALENFDVIGGYRTRYRSNDQGDPVTKTLHGRKIWEYKLGPDVDASGQFEGEETFEGIHDFKQILLQRKEVVIRSFVSHLIVFATGNPIEFADRSVIDEIMATAETKDYGTRDLIHAVIQSKVFRHQ